MQSRQNLTLNRILIAVAFGVYAFLSGGNLTAQAAGDDGFATYIGWTILAMISIFIGFIGYIIGAALKFSWSLFLLLVTNMALIAVAASFEGFAKVIDRWNVVLTILTFINLGLIVGWVLGRRANTDSPTYSDKEPAQHG
jgi:predicted Na+-dependent transporter